MTKSGKKSLRVIRLKFQLHKLFCVYITYHLYYNDMIYYLFIYLFVLSQINVLFCSVLYVFQHYVIILPTCTSIKRVFTAWGWNGEAWVHIPGKSLWRATLWVFNVLSWTCSSFSSFYFGLVVLKKGSTFSWFFWLGCSRGIDIYQDFIWKELFFESSIV